MRQVAIFRPEASLNPSLTSYVDLLSGASSGLRETESTVKCIWPCSGYFRNIYIELAGAPGVGASWTFTLRIDGVDTAAVIVIAGTNTFGIYTADIPVVAGQLVSMRCVPAGSPDLGASSQEFIAWEFAGINRAESGYAAGGSTLTRAVTPMYSGVFNPSGDGWDSNDPVNVYNVAACGGVITAMYGYLAAGNLSGGAYQWTLVKNGVDQDGTGGTANTVLTLSPETGEVVGNVSFEVRVDPGDLFYLRSDAILGDFFEPPSRQISVGFRFRADRDGESQFCTTISDTTRTDGDPEWAPIRSTETPVLWRTPESLAVTRGGITTFGLKDLHVVAETAPGTDNSHLFVMRLNEVDQVLQVELANDEVFAADLVHHFRVQYGDRIAMRRVGTSNPAATKVAIGMTQFIGAVIGPLVWVHWPRSIP